jgi:hypothetical protein
MKQLNNNDKITFKVGNKSYHYIVGNTILSCTHDYNHAIFKALGMSDYEKDVMAELNYGYKPTDDGSWPPFRKKDYDAATNLVKRLYDLCNIHNTKES